MLSVHGVSVRLTDQVVLNDVDLVVKPNERLVVLGASGSGKSTLLRVIAGLQEIEQGRVVLRGDDVTDVPVHERGIGLMFQDSMLFPHMSVGRNIAYGLRMRGDSREFRSQRVAELLDLVGLATSVSAQRAVTELSGGEQQRVALARSLAPSPDILLLDEPFASLDAVLRGRLADDVRALTQRLGTTVVAVTHDRAEAFAFADRIAILDQGRVAQCATPEELWAQPGSELVARLIGLVVLAPAVLAGAADEAAGIERIAVRPVGITVRAVGPGATVVDSGRLRGQGVVESRSASGDAVRLSVLLDGRVDDPLRRVQVDVAPDAALLRGARVEVSVAPDAVVRLASNPR